MDKPAHRRRHIGSVFLCHKRSYDSRQHVATARGSHSGIARGVDKHLAVGAKHKRVMPFKHYHDFQELRHLDRTVKTLLVCKMFAKQSVELAHMGRYHGALRNIVDWSA